MRRDGIPYNSVPRNYYPPVDYTKMGLKELTEKYIKTCGKANGALHVCSKCDSPCEYGKRAMQLVANEIYNDPPVPLFAGKTMVQMAQEENMRRKANVLFKDEPVKSEEAPEEKPIEKKEGKGGRVYIDDWYKLAKESGDAVKWIMETYNVSKSKAKQKIYGWLNRHPEDREVVAPVVKIEEKEIEKIEEPKPVERKAGDDVVFLTIEGKIDELVRKQEEYKKKAEEYSKLYKDVTEQIDVLYKAWDVFNK